MHTCPITATRLAVALALAGLGAGAQAAAGAASPIVGEATLVIGAARLWSEDGSARPVTRGTAVRVGDRLETEGGGHVHLRFVDGGRLSVRPASRLQIESYSHTPGQPQLGAIKLRLDEGVARSITGAWGEAARERFRLNTPVAAIGVKGTDFIVRADADLTAATVYSGAIAVTPLASGCGASVGPCLNGHERMLSADMKGQMLELTRSQSSPVLVAVADPAAVAAAVRAARPERGPGTPAPRPRRGRRARRGGRRTRSCARAHPRARRLRRPQRQGSGRRDRRRHRGRVRAAAAPTAAATASCAAPAAAAPSAAPSAAPAGAASAAAACG